MKCADPVLCYTDSKSKKIYRHFSMASEILKRAPHKVFSCGKCLYCRKKKAYELAARCVLHASLYPNNCFLTLTYDEKNPDYHNRFNYRDIQKFKKKLRQHVWRQTKQRIEVYNVHEYGKNGKKHWHLIVFNYRPEDLRVHTVRSSIPLYSSRDLDRLWSHGFTAVGDVSEASAMYQSQYMHKDFKNGNTGTERKSNSRHQGIGGKYFLKHYDQILRLGYVPFSGKKMPLPRYFEKLAHKHYCHYYDQSYFFDHKERKRRYTPFKNGEENKAIADLFIKYQTVKEEKINELTRNWEEVIERYIKGEAPEFIQSGSNAEYDLKNKLQLENF